MSTTGMACFGTGQRQWGRHLCLPLFSWAQPWRAVGTQPATVAQPVIRWLSTASLDT